MGSRAINWAKDKERRAAIESSRQSHEADAQVNAVYYEQQNKTNKERIQAILANPLYTPAAQDDFYTNTLAWLADNSFRVLTRKMLGIMRSVEIRLRDGQPVQGGSWKYRPKPVPAVLQNLPKKPPGRQ